MEEENIFQGKKYNIPGDTAVVYVVFFLSVFFFFRGVGWGAQVLWWLVSRAQISSSRSIFTLYFLYLLASKRIDKIFFFFPQQWYYSAVLGRFCMTTDYCQWTFKFFSMRLIGDLIVFSENSYSTSQS